MNTNIHAHSKLSASIMALALLIAVPEEVQSQVAARLVRGPVVEGDSASSMGMGSRYRASLSANGRFAVFESFASNLVPGDGNKAYDVFVRDMLQNQTTRVSVNSLGDEANGHSTRATISADGRYVAFSSTATNLVPDDTNAAADIFVHDLVQHTTVRVSVDSDGLQSNGNSIDPVLSADGAIIAFTSGASNLDPRDGNATWDVYSHDRKSGVTALISRTPAGLAGNAASGSPAISADGQVVVFNSDAGDLVPEDTNAEADVFYVVGDAPSIRASVASDGAQANARSLDPDISDDAGTIVFMSLASNLTAGDDNDAYDIYVRKLVSGTTGVVSASASGEHADAVSFGPALSGDGSKVSFFSLAHNLIDNDTTTTQTDVYVKNLKNGVIEVASVDSEGTQGNYDNRSSSLSGDGSIVVFESASTNLVADDKNGFFDVFTRNLATGSTRRISMSNQVTR
jgi:Tol biopolymer transport system component